MTKKDIAQAVASRTDVSAGAAEEILGAALDVIGEQLAKGEDVRLAGFGTFETRRARRPHRPQPADRRGDRHRRVDVGRLQGGGSAEARRQRLTPTARPGRGADQQVGAPFRVPAGTGGRPPRPRRSEQVCRPETEGIALQTGTERLTGSRSRAATCASPAVGVAGPASSHRDRMPGLRRAADSVPRAPKTVFSIGRRCVCSRPCTSTSAGSGGTPPRARPSTSSTRAPTRWSRR